jgi:hypothetical protein
MTRKIVCVADLQQQLQPPQLLKAKFRSRGILCPPPGSLDELPVLAHSSGRFGGTTHNRIDTTTPVTIATVDKVWENADAHSAHFFLPHTRGCQIETALPFLQALPLFVSPPQPPQSV